MPCEKGYSVSSLPTHSSARSIPSTKCGMDFEFITVTANGYENQRPEDSHSPALIVCSNGYSLAFSDSK
jgi:hypothetical protein